MCVITSHIDTDSFVNLMLFACQLADADRVKYKVESTITYRVMDLLLG